jgi:predicted metalloprotease with PDZ domain
MSVRLASALALFAITATASAQHPLVHFSDGVDARFARAQPIVSYRLRVDPRDLSGFAVEMRVRNAPDTIRLAMAAHPEYDDRYWRYLTGLSAETRAGASMPVREDSALWRLATRGGEAVVRYRIQLPVPQESPRASWRPFLTTTGGLVGGPHAFLYIVGATLAPSHVTLDLPAEWSVATGMTPTADARTFFAPTVDALVDSPMLVGRFRSWVFTIDGVPHRVVYWPTPDATPFDTTALVTGVEAITRQAIALFGRAPYRDYTFIYQDGAYGGLEHRNSVTIGAPSAELARGPRFTLGETAHEYVHTWNLMRIRPDEYGDVSYRTQKPVAGLWFSEGLTMHYADVLQRRARLAVSDSTRVAHLETLIGRYLANPGNARFSAEAISRVAYNAQPGALGDYNPSVHLVGELLGNVLDLAVRAATDNRSSMDDVMPQMLERYSGPRGFTGRDIERTVGDVCRCDVSRLFDRYVRGAGSIDFDHYLGLAGLRSEVSWTPALDRDGRPELDLRMRAFSPAPGEPLRMFILNPSSTWGRAGLHTNDRLVSIGGRAVSTWPEVRAAVSAARLGDTLRVEVVRAGGARDVAKVGMTGFNRPVVRIVELPEATPRQRAVRAAWLASARRGSRARGNGSRQPLRSPAPSSATRRSLREQSGDAGSQLIR